MKKFICKYEYDTDSAVIVKKYVYGNFGETTGYEETLYQMPDGKYFIYVNGGADSLYKKEDIKRIGKDKVDAWIKEHA